VVEQQFRVRHVRKSKFEIDAARLLKGGQEVIYFGNLFARDQAAVLFNTNLERMLCLQIPK